MAFVWLRADQKVGWAQRRFCGNIARAAPKLWENSLGEKAMVNQQNRFFIGALVTICMFLLVVRPGLAGDDLSLSQLEGDWTAAADPSGDGLTGALSWHPAFGGKFYLVDYRLSKANGDSQIVVFHGLAYYKNEAGPALSAFWADSNGDLLPIQAELEGSALMANWGELGGKRGRTRYVLTTSEKLVVTDWIEKDGSWKQFRQVEYKKNDKRNDSEKTESHVTGIDGLFPRARGPDKLVSVPQTKGVEVRFELKTYPNGRFARIAEPEGNPVEPWEPKK